jgi:hypothetical protein
MEEYVDIPVDESDPVICPWCGTRFEIRPGTNCSNCGGPLPLPPGPDRGDAPPPAPRKFPEGYKLRMIFRNNWSMYTGTIMFLFGLQGALGPIGVGDIFPLIGLAMICNGFYRANRKMKVLEHGLAAEGSVLDAGENESTSENGRHPYFIKYEYEVNGKLCTGFMNCWDESSTSFKPGDPIWVVYIPDGIDYKSSLWPPVA